jgi:elongation factor G
MPKPDLKLLRNMGVIAHIDAGKTTTTEHILYYAGAIHRLGGVDEGNTVTDWMELEQEKGITIQSACVPFEWQESLTKQTYQVNLIDTPGHVDFTAEVERSLRVLDGCVVVFDAQKGVEAQSETVWRQADKYRVPRLIFINKMDIVGADFDNAVHEVFDRLQGRPVPVTAPIGSGSVKDSPTPFGGVIDLITMEACYFESSNPARQDGRNVIRMALDRAASPGEGRQPVTPEMRAAALRWREKLFDVITEVDEQDRITSAYLAGEPVDPVAIHALLRQRTLTNEIQPLYCGSGREHLGVQLLLDGICRYLPSPLDRPPVHGKNPKKDKDEVRKPEPDEPLAALVFKMQADPHGELYYLRIYSGTLKSSSRPYNPGKDIKELLTKIYHVHADPSHKDQLDAAYAGDIVAVIGPRKSITGDTLCDPQHPILLESIHFAESVISMSIEPDSTADKQKLEDTLTLLTREDPTFHWHVDRDTGQTLISGMGVLHLEIKTHRLREDFRIKARVGKPRVSYRETLREPRQVQGAFPRFETYVDVRFEPIASTSMQPPVVVEAHDFPDVPLVLREAAKQGIQGAMQSGDLGFPVLNVRAAITGYTVDPALSTDVALQAAGANAAHKALRDNIYLLEPIMRLEVTVPEEYLGPVTADLNARRAEIRQIHARGKLRVIEALVPLAKIFDYADKVRSLSQGRASSTLEPHSYRQAPDDDLQQLLHPEGF